MTKQLEQVIETARKYPEGRQNELAEALTADVETTPHTYTDEQLTAIDEGLTHADASRPDRHCQWDRI